MAHSNQQWLTDLNLPQNSSTVDSLSSIVALFSGLANMLDVVAGGASRISKVYNKDIESDKKSAS